MQEFVPGGGGPAELHAELVWLNRRIGTLQSDVEVSTPSIGNYRRKFQKLLPMKLPLQQDIVVSCTRAAHPA